MVDENSETASDSAVPCIYASRSGHPKVEKRKTKNSATQTGGSDNDDSESPTQSEKNNKKRGLKKNKKVKPSQSINDDCKPKVDEGSLEQTLLKKYGEKQEVIIELLSRNWQFPGMDRIQRAHSGKNSDPPPQSGAKPEQEETDGTGTGKGIIS